MSIEGEPPEPRAHLGSAPQRGETGDASLGLPAVWLRYNCPCGQCRDPRTGQRLAAITDVAPDVRVVAARRSGNRVEIEFAPDGHQATFDTRWLAEFEVTDRASQSSRPGWPGSPGEGPPDDDRGEDAKRLWSAAEIAAGLQQGSWPLFESDAAHRRACLTAVLRDGFVVLQHVPLDHAAVVAVAQSISFVRETERGRVMDLTTRPSLANPAYSRRPIPPSTAQAFRDPPPTLHLMHCLVSAPEGGETTLVDGFKVASMLRHRNPAAFGVLASTPVTFAWADATAELRATRPVIVTDSRGRITEIRYSAMSMQPVRLPPAQTTEFYAAYRAFAELAGRRELTLTLRLRAGECLIHDNTRILAGRTGFPDAQNRRVQVCWADIDPISSALARMRHTSSNGHARA